MTVKQNYKANQLQKVKQNGKRSRHVCRKNSNLALKTGAGEGIRTLDVLLGKQALYR